MRDIVVTEESLSNLKASSTTESSENITFANDCISDHSVIISEHLMCDRVQWKYLAWADACSHDVYAVAEEEFVYFFYLFTYAEDALVSPVVLKIITADPFASSLPLIG